MLQARLFTGINTWTPSGDLEPGELQIADNVFIEGGDDKVGGDIVSRPGWVGLFEIALGYPIYAETPYLKADGTTQVLFVCNGKLYRYQKGELAPTELKNAATSASFAFVSSAVFMSRLGVYMYIVDGSGTLVRTDLSADTAETVTGIAPPVDAPSVSLISSAVIDPMTSIGYAYTDLATVSSATVVTSVARPFTADDVNKVLNITGGSGWTIGPVIIDSVTSGNATVSASVGGSSLTGGVATLLEWFSSPYVVNPDTNMLLNGGFESNTGDDQPPVDWTVLANDPDVYSNTASATLPYAQAQEGTYFLQLDKNDSMQQSNLAIPQNVYGGGYARIIQLSMWIRNAGGSNMGANVTLQGFDSVGNQVWSGEVIMTVPYSADVNAWTNKILVADMSTLAASDPATTIAVTITGTSGVATFKSLYVDTITLTALDPQLSLAVRTGGGFNISATTTYLNNAYIESDYGVSGKDFSKSQELTFGYQLLNLPSNPSLQVLMLGAASTGDTEWYTLPVVWDPGNRYFYVDVTTIPGTTLAAIRYVIVQMTAALPTTTTTAQLSNMFAIGPITQSGNLSVSTITGNQYGPVQYLFTEMSDADNLEYVVQLVNVIESDGSPVSPAYQPTGATATAAITFPALVNATATWRRCYRAGGVFTDGLYRLIASIPVVANIGLRPAGSAYSAGTIAVGGDVLNIDNLNPYISWDGTTLIDDTPDSFLFNATEFQIGRNQPPTGAQSIVAWQNRLILAVGSTVYASWNVVADTEAGLYYTTYDITTDPNLSLKGATFGIGAADNDKVQRMIVLGSYLFIFKQYSVWVMTGTDPTNYTLTQFLSEAGIGLVAPRAVAIVTTAGMFGIPYNYCWFLGADGVYAFNGTVALNESIKVEKVLNLKNDDGTILIDADSYSHCAMFMWNRSLYLMAPSGTNTSYTAYLQLCPGTTTTTTTTLSSTTTPSGTPPDEGGPFTICPSQQINAVMYKFDTRMGAWTRYLLAATSGATLSSSTDTNDPYFGGYDGQLYTLEGPLDYATPGAVGSPVPITVKTKAFGQEQPGYVYFTQTRPTRAFIDTASPGGTQWSLSVFGDNTTYTQGYLTNPGEQAFKVKLPPSTAGLKVSIGLSANVNVQTRIRAIGLDAAKGTMDG